MKPPIPILLTILLIALPAAGANAQDSDSGSEGGNGVCRFIDEDGDGFNDLAPDADGDGIPNGLDPDYVKPRDGTGLMNQWAHKYSELFSRYFGQDVMSAMNGPGDYSYGPGDGSGTGTGSGEGYGFGPGTGVGDFSGDGESSSQGTQERRGGRRK